MFAQAPPPTPPPPPPRAIFQNTEFYLLLGALAVILLAGAVILHFVDRWRRTKIDAEPNAGRETLLDLSAYREMYENGEITKSEYDKILAKLAVKMKHEVGLADSPAPPPHSPDSPPSDKSPPPTAAG
jgi:hypothetical protein